MVEYSVEQQVLVFLILCLTGFLTGVFFDLVRALKKIFLLHRRSVFVIDMLFSLAVTFVVFQVLFQTYWGEVRVFVFFAFFSGVILYYLLLSRSAYRFFVFFFKKSRKLILKILSVWQGLQNKSRIIVNQGRELQKRLFRKEK